jgi:hypothetical protein
LGLLPATQRTKSPTRGLDKSGSLTYSPGHRGEVPGYSAAQAVCESELPHSEVVSPPLTTDPDGSPTLRANNTMPRKITKTVDQELSEYAAKRRAVSGELVREQIQVTQLVNTLQDFALGKGKAKLDGPRLKAIEMLLDKSVPDLASIKHEVEAKNVMFVIDTDFKPQAA